MFWVYAEVYTPDILQADGAKSSSNMEYNCCNNIMKRCVPDLTDINV